MKRFAVALMTVGMLLSAPVRGQESRYYAEGRHLVHELSGTIAAGGRAIRIESDLGTVRVDSAPEEQVRYRIRIRARAADEQAARQVIETLGVSAIRSADRIFFRGESYGREVPPGLSAEFALTVPAATPRLEIVSGVGDIDVEGIDGAVTLITRGGRIAARRLGGPLEAETRGGDILVGDVRADARLSTGGGSVVLASAGGDLTAKTSGGDVQIGRVAGKVRAETGGGSVRVDSANGAVSAGTTGGNISLGSIGGPVSATSAGGSIRVKSAAGAVRCETAAGPIDLGRVVGPVRAITSAGDIRAHILVGAGDFADSNLQSLLGDVTVSLPESLPVTIRALVDNPTGLGIRSEFPLEISREIESLGRAMEIGEGEIGGGGSILKIQALGGNIVILKRVHQPPEPGH